MTNELDNRIRILEEQLSSIGETVKQPRRHRKLMTISAILFTLALLSSFLIYASISSKSTDRTITNSSAYKSAGFPVYLADPLPTGFIYNSNETSNDSNTFTYSLSSKSGTIAITQQPVPTERIQLQTISGFNAMGSPVGQAVSGNVNGRRVAIVQTETTLINISGSKGIAAEAISTFVKNLQPTK